MESDAVTIRAAEASDVPAIVALVSEVLPEFGLTFGDGSATDAELTNLPEVYSDGGGAFWVATDASGAMLGTCGVFRLSEDTFELRKMYLLSRSRGLGVGKRLLGRAVDFARAAGARSLVLDTTDQMTQAIAFYERNGFVRDDAQVRGSRCHRGYRLELGVLGA